MRNISVVFDCCKAVVANFKYQLNVRVLFWVKGIKGFKNTYCLKIQALYDFSSIFSVFTVKRIEHNANDSLQIPP